MTDSSSRAAALYPPNRAMLTPASNAVEGFFGTVLHGEHVRQLVVGVRDLAQLPILLSELDGVPEVVDPGEVPAEAPGGASDT